MESPTSSSRNGRRHTTRYYGLPSLRLPCSSLRDGGGQSEKRVAAHWHLQSNDRLVDGLRGLSTTINGVASPLHSLTEWASSQTLPGTPLKVSDSRPS